MRMRRRRRGCHATTLENQCDAAKTGVLYFHLVRVTLSLTCPVDQRTCSNSSSVALAVTRLQPHGHAYLPGLQARFASKPKAA